LSESAFAITSAIAILELIESLPPLKMQALPDLKVSPNASAVTLGLDSYIIATTPRGTLFVPITSPLGLFFMPVTSPTGSSRPVRTLIPSAIALILLTSSVSLSIRAGFIPLVLALTRSFSLAAIIYSALETSASATASSALFFSSIPRLARYLDAFLALIPICSSDSINSPSL